MSRGSLLVPIAIVVAGGLIGVGIYAGLRDRTSSVAAPAASPAPIPSVASASASASPSAHDDLAVRVGEQLRLALEARRARYTAACWTPIVADGGLTQSLYRFVLTVDADGNETRRDVRLTEKMSREDVARCLRTMKDAPLGIAPPGKETTVSVELAFP